MKKKQFLFVFILLLFISCEKVVDISVRSIQPKLVIDAFFEVLFEETPVTANTVVKLRLSADYFDEKIPIVTNATVFLTNESDTIRFLDTNLDGNYKPITPFIPEDAIAYELTIIHKEQTYKGATTKVKSTPLIEVKQGDRTLFSGKETEVIATFKDTPSITNYYLFDFSNTNFLILEDDLFNGQKYDVSTFFDEEEDEIELPTTITVKMSGVSKEYFTYFKILLDQSGQNGGGPFQSIPSSLLGNMINKTTESNFPLGYFHISETDKYPVNLVKKTE